MKPGDFSQEVKEAICEAQRGVYYGLSYGLV